MATRKGTRIRTLSEKGEAYQYESHVKQFRKIESDILKRLSHIENLIKSDSSDPSVVRSEIKHVDNLQRQFLFVLEKAQAIFSTKNVIEEFNDWTEKLDQEIFFAKSSCISWLKKVENDSDNRSKSKTKSKSSSSKTSSKQSFRSKSSRSSRLVDEKTELAALEVRREFAKQKGATERLLDIEEEIAVRRAKIDVLQSHVHSSNNVQEVENLVIDESKLLNRRTSKSLNENSVPLDNQISISVAGNSFSSTSKEDLCNNPVHTSVPDTMPFVVSPVSSFSVTSESVRKKPYVSFSTVNSEPMLHSTIYTSPRVCSGSIPNRVNPTTTTVLTPVSTPSQSDASIEKLCELFQLQSAPDIDLDVFNGDPLEFNFFITSFQEVVEKKIKDSVGRLQRLINFTTGDAKELAKSCVYDTQYGYDTAKRLLKSRYGDPHRVLSAYSKELKEWKFIRSGDSDSLRKFYTFLMKCKNVVEGNYLNALDSIDNLCTILSKLPGNSREKWNRKALSLRSKQFREPELKDMISFIEEELTLWSDPLFSKEALEQRKLLTDRNPSFNRPPSSSSNKGFRNYHIQIKCRLCESDHDIEYCPLFKNKSIRDKVNLLMRFRLCFGCFSRNHVVTACKNIRTCRTCNKKHPTSLHGYVPKSRTSPKTDSSNSENPSSNTPVSSSVPPTTSHSVPITSALVSGESAVSMCIVPVFLTHPKSKREVKTFALLDACSQGSFIDEALLKTFCSDFIETNITIKTINGCCAEDVKKVEGLLVRNVNNKDWSKLSTVYTREDLDIDGDVRLSSESIENWPYLSKISDQISECFGGKVGILIGSNCPKLIEPIRVIPSENKGPYAFETKLGWCIVGPLNSDSLAFSCHRVSVKDNGVENMLKKLYEIESVPSVPVEGDEVSQDDLKFMEIMNSDVEKVDGHYVIPLPFRDKNASIGNNLRTAERRLFGLKRRFEKDEKFKNDYISSVSTLLEKGYARKVSCDYPEGKNWFIPHHGVYHPRKGKLRVVWDCSSSTGGVSLNDLLLQGPDLTNDLLGVLIRFREEKIAFMADIEAMFYQVKVPKNQRGFFQFLWWEDGDTSRPYERYEMCVHVFGATSSPSCSNFALKSSASEGKTKYGEEAFDALNRSFYVDDLLKSTFPVSKASNLIKNVIPMCKEGGGFRLTKFVSNVPEVLKDLPNEDKKVIESETLNLCQSETALGLPWNVQKDTLSLCNMSLKESKPTRRGILSTVSSIYDPLGIASPFVLEGKLILQKLCQLNLNWDDSLPDSSLKALIDWKSNLPCLKEIVVPRCYKPAKFSDVIKDVSLHHFSDASDFAYGCCSYVRLVDSNEQIHCSLVVGKSRVAPIKQVSTPRLELMAAGLNVKVAKVVRRELDYDVQSEFFYTDSTIVLGYIKNESKRFKRFVANRVRAIIKSSESNQWHHVDGNLNPSDVTTRGLKPSSDKIDLWLNGPKFLWDKTDFENLPCETYEVSESDPECISSPIKVNAIQTSDSAQTTDSMKDIVSHLEANFSSFPKMLRVFAYVLKAISKMKKKKVTCELSVKDLDDSFTTIKKLLQEKYFSKDLIALKNKSKNSLSSLDPFVDELGLIRVGGRLSRSLLDFAVKHPVVLPKQSSISEAIVRHFHDKVHHSGRGITMNSIRDSGLWITNLNSLVKSVIGKCVSCKKLRGCSGIQFMSDLPADRVEPSPPFTYVGIDLFGPFLVKERRSELKRYGVMFTCLSCRGVHLECANFMTTDSFILALRRFLSRRGKVREIRSDNGSNFIGAKRELQAAFKNMNHDKISRFLKSEGTDWVKWKNNPPYSSHFGGVWERQIRSVRQILNGILLSHGLSLNDESLKTFLCEVESIVNSRPLTVDCLSDPLSPKPLSPSNLLMNKHDVILPPPGDFESADLYSRKYWRRIQHLTNEFWRRWSKEYLQQQQERPKWSKRRRNFCVGDVVLIKEETKRNEWPMAVIVDVKKDEHGDVRSVTCKTMTNEQVVRPISKVIILVESPPTEPKS